MNIINLIDRVMLLNSELTRLVPGIENNAPIINEFQSLIQEIESYKQVAELSEAALLEHTNDQTVIDI